MDPTPPPPPPPPSAAAAAAAAAASCLKRKRPHDDNDSPSPSPPPPYERQPRPRRRTERTLSVLLQALVGAPVVVELKNDAEARGVLQEADDQMKCVQGYGNRLCAHHRYGRASFDRTHHGGSNQTTNDAAWSWRAPWST